MTLLARRRLTKAGNLSGIISTLLAISLTACQTAPLSPARTLATTAPDPKLVALVERDAIEALGLYSHAMILNQVAARVRLGRHLQAPTYQEHNLLYVVPTSLGLQAGGALIGFIYHSSKTDSANMTTRDVKSYGGFGAAGATLLISSVVFGSDFYEGGSTNISDERESASSHEPDKNVFGFVHKYLRAKNVRDREQAKADALNAEQKAAFEAGLKNAVGVATRRATSLFQLNAMEASRFELRVEERILDSFRTRETWGPNDVVQIDIASILRVIVPNSQERLETLGRILDAAGKEKIAKLDTNEDLVEWLQSTERELRKLESEVVLAYRAARRERDPKLQPLMPQFEKLGNDIDILAKRIAIHAKTAKAATATP